MKYRGGSSNNNARVFCLFTFICLRFCVVRCELPIISDKSVITLSLKNYNVNDPDGESFEVKYLVRPKSNCLIQVTSIPEHVHFIIVQVHSYMRNMTLSYNLEPTSSTSISGINIGLVKINTSPTLNYYLSYNTSNDTATVMIAIQAYTVNDPISGGCNMEFQVETSPFLKTKFDHAITEIDFAPAAPSMSLMSNFSVANNDMCNLVPDPVSYNMYKMYLPDRNLSQDLYFNSLKMMMTKGRIVRNGHKIRNKYGVSPTRYLFASYPGTGSVFVIIAETVNGSSVYVPSLTYSCHVNNQSNDCKVLTESGDFQASVRLNKRTPGPSNLIYWLEDTFLWSIPEPFTYEHLDLLNYVSEWKFTFPRPGREKILVNCSKHSVDARKAKKKSTTFSKLLCSAIFFLGLFACFAAHRFFRIEILLLGFLSGSIVCYTLALNFHSSDPLSLAVGVGFALGASFIVVWCLRGMPLFSLIVATSVLGYLMASSIFYKLVDVFDAFQSDVNYWTLFCSVILLAPILLVSLAEKANIIACSVVGSFVSILAIEYYIGSNLRYIIINTVRRATVPRFNHAIIDPRFQTKDIVLTSVWAILALAGITVQLLLVQGRPPYPAPYNPFKTLLKRYKETSSIGKRPNETTPLLRSYA